MRLAKYRKEAHLIRRYSRDVQLFIAKAPYIDEEGVSRNNGDYEVFTVSCAPVEMTERRNQELGGIYTTDDIEVFSLVKFPADDCLLKHRNKVYRIEPRGDYSDHGQHYEYIGRYNEKLQDFDYVGKL